MASVMPTVCNMKAILWSSRIDMATDLLEIGRWRVIPVREIFVNTLPTLMVTLTCPSKDPP